jgi:soluble lytic murein transglycosylase
MALPVSAGNVRTNPLVGKDRDLARDAFKAADRGDWKNAFQISQKVSDGLVFELIVWDYLTSPGAQPQYSDLRAFMLRHPTWPSQERLRYRAEEALEKETPETIVAWLGRFPPISSAGKIRLAEARMAIHPQLIKSAEILELLREGFKIYDFTPAQEESFLAKHGSILREQDFAERIDRLLWEEKITPARRLMKRVSPARQKLYNARILLMQDAKKAEDEARDVSPSLKGDPGLLYARIKWRERRGSKDDLERKLLALPSKLDYAEQWWALKLPYIYRFMSQRRYQDAYQLSRDHNAASGQVFAEAEFLAGWIALRFLNQPRLAYRHFYKLYHGVETPLSRSRAAYWASRAARANGNRDIESNWLLVASQFPTVFYGQLAAVRRGDKTLNIHKQAEATTNDREAFGKNELVRAAILLDALGRRNDAKEFLKAGLENSKTFGERLLISRYGTERGELDLTIAVSKHAASIGSSFMESGYPILNSIRGNRPEPALVHSIIRQESLFDPEARSGVGATGLMQLMPATAKQLAQQMGMHYNLSKLTNPEFNIALGSRYLSNLIDNYNGSYLLAIAAYNAGPGNVNKWIKEMGDPRLVDDVDVIVDWVESIPFKETRNYVHRVMEAMQVYRHSIRPDLPAKNMIVEDIKR